MARELPNAGGSGAPFAKFAKIGDTLVGCFAGAKNRQQQKYDPTGQGKRELLWKNEEQQIPLLEEVAWFIAMPGCTAGIGKRGELETIADEAQVRFSFKGFKWGQVIEARKLLPAKPYLNEKGEKKTLAAGRTGSGDIYEIVLAGYSSACDNEKQAVGLGLTVINNRIVMRTKGEHRDWVDMRLERNENTNAAADYTFSVRRPQFDDEFRYEALADDLFDTAPWASSSAVAHDANEAQANDDLDLDGFG